MALTNADKFANLDFEGFRQLAKDDSLSAHEKIGFPDEYRDGKETIIFDDIKRKLTNLRKKNQLVVDIGPGCGALAFLLIEHCRANGDTLILIDSPEMLNQLPDGEGVVKIPAYYPDECADFLERYRQKANVVLTYSVFHYVFGEGNSFDFLDKTLALLEGGGEFLIGDIPNVSKRKRFFASETGIKFHKEFMKTDEKPSVEFNALEPNQIDDAVVFSLLMRARLAGFDAYVVPQSTDLPMANRREDILFRRP
jgi:hypothetical protein